MNIDRSTNDENPKDLDAIYDQAIRDLKLPPIKDISHRYCFVSGGDSLYIKLGASCKM